ncbi:MAG TPA: glycosyltransferase, partial [Ignavibacteriaceae bacterium]
IIASDIPGNNEFIVNKKNGLLFNINGPEELREAIFKISDDKTFSKEIAANAYKDVMSNYLLKNYSDALLSFLRQITSK